MDNSILDRLLLTTNEDDFMEIIYQQKEDYQHDRSRWSEDMINHFLSISDYTREEFEWNFTLEPPVDDFDE